MSPRAAPTPCVGRPLTVPADLLDAVRARLAADGSAATAAPTAAQIAAAVRATPGLRADGDVRRIVAALQGELVGAGALQPLLADPAVTDVLVHAGGQVWVDRGHGLARAALSLDGEVAVRALAVRLVAATGRRLDVAQPYADATLPGGHRVHAVLPPVAVDGTCLSLRTVRPQAFDLPALQAAGFFPAQTLPWIRAVLEVGLAAVVTGATGAGKTTLLGALIGAWEPALRVVVVEDATELRPDHPQVVRLQSRPPNIEGTGEVPLRALVRQALRMRPDRLVLGEARGPEIVDLLVALNTGHAGGLCTLHANSPHDVPARVEALAALAGLPRGAAHSLLAPALRVVLHVTRDGSGRHLAEVAVLAAHAGGEVRCDPALVVVGSQVERGPGFAALCAMLGPASPVLAGMG